MEIVPNKEIIKIPFCALDFETTQTMEEPGELAIIEIGAQHFMGGEVQGKPYETLVNPGCKIRPFDTGVSGISDQKVFGQPRFSKISSDFFSYIKDRIIVAHNAPFDQRALRSQCQRDSIDEPENIFIDTVALLKKIINLPKYNLQNAALHFNLDKKPSHRALDDCLIVIELFLEIQKILKTKYGIWTVGQMLKLLGIEISPKVKQHSLFNNE